MSELRCAVIGAGHFGRFHADKYAGEPGARLVAVVDRDRDRAAAIAQRHGAEALDDHRALAGRVDAVSIATPTETHHPVAAFFLDAGVHVLVEKPITATLQEADDLIARAEAKGLVLQVGHLERFQCAAAGLPAAVTRPLYIEAQRIAPYKGGRGADVSVVLDLMIHDIDLVASLAGAPVVSVDAVGAPVLSPSEDIVHARLKFENGCVATVVGSRIAEKAVRSLRIYQPDSLITVDLLDRRVAHLRRTDRTESPFFDTAERSFGDADALRAEIRGFLGAVAAGTPPLVTGRDGRAALAIAGQITDSLRRQMALFEARQGAFAQAPAGSGAAPASMKAGVAP